MGTNRNFVNSTHIGSGVNQTAEASLTLRNMGIGDMAIINAETGAVIPTNAAGAALAPSTLVKIVTGLSGGGIRYTKAFSKNTLSGVAANVYAPGVDQISYVGFNGVSGNLPSEAGQEYRLDVEIQHRQRIRGEKVGGDSFFITASTVNSSAIETARRFMLLFNTRKSNGTYKNYKDKYVRGGIIADGTLAASTQAVEVTYKSPKITFTTAAADANGTYAIGDWLRLGGSVNTTQVYNVIKVDGLTLTLDRVYEGANDSLATSASGRLTDITFAGLVFTGIPQKDKPLDTFEWLKFVTRVVTGDPLSPDAGATVTTDAVLAYPGNGVTGQVKDVEYFSDGYEGVNSRTEFYDAAINGPSDVVNTALYHTVALDFLSEADDQFQGKRTFPCRANLFLAVGANQVPVDGEQAYNAGNEFLHILNGVCGTSVTLQA